MTPKLILATSLCVFLVRSGLGAVVSDGSLGAGLVGNSLGNYSIPRTAGLLKGTNLFHSFSQFNLGTGETATFNDLRGVTNVLARVTGGASSIDGRISCAANLFLINPRGFLFGPNATLDVAGSFVASTADYVRFTDGGKFQAVATAGELDTLTAAPVSAFGFLETSPGAVTFTGSQLSAANGQELSVVGGNITLDGAALSAPSGGLSLVSAGGVGEVPHGVAALLTKPAAVVPAMGEIRMTNGAAANIDGAGGGKLVIRGGKLVVEGASVVSSKNRGAVVGGDVDVRVTGDLGIVGGSEVNALALSSGNGGGLRVQAKNLTIDGAAGEGRLTGISGSAEVGSTGDAGLLSITVEELLAMRGGGQILASTFGGGRGGDLNVRAKNLTIDGAAGEGRLTGISGSAEPGSTGDAGVLSIIVEELLAMRGGGQILASTFGGGRGGDLYLQAGNLSIDGVTGAGRLTGISGSAEPDSTGNAGLLSITVDGLLSLSAGGQVLAATFSSGRAGDLYVQAKNLTIDGARAAGRYTGISGSAAAGSTGNAGLLSVTVGELLSLRGGGQISASTFASGRGGDLRVRAKNLTVDGATEAGRLTGISGGAEPGSAGDAGLLSITVEELLLLRGGGQILAITFGSGRAGDLNVQARNLTIDGATAAGRLTGISGSAEAGSTGNAGLLSITVEELLLLRGGGQILAATFSSGMGGDLNVRAKSLTIDGAVAGRLTGISGSAEPGSTGDAGLVSVAVEELLSLSGGGQILSSTFSSGKGGGLSVQAKNLTIDGAASAGRHTGIEGSAEADSTGDAAQVGVEVFGALRVRGSGQISAASRGRGAAGGLRISADRVFLSDSGKIAVSSDYASGGEIRLLSGSFIEITTGGAITASAALGGGNVTIQAPNRILLYDSTISATAGGTSRGGNIRIDPEFLILNRATISANAAFGQGGDILLQSQHYLSSMSSVTATGSTAGSVQISAPKIDLSGALGGLPVQFADASTRLQERCAMRLGGEVSSFLVVGRGGIAADPGGLFEETALWKRRGRR